MKSPIGWYGGKGRIIKRIAKYVPEGGAPYCEPYCGGASLFFARKPADSEVLNDLNRDLVNLYRCLQDEDKFKRLSHALRWTLYSLSEFKRALKILKSDERDAVKRAWAMFVAYRQGFAGEAETEGDWGRNLDRSPAWGSTLELLESFNARLKEVHVDCRDALEVIRYWDNPQAVFYVDPPYHHERRKSSDDYECEADDGHHQALVNTLLGISGSATLSCYWHDVYIPLIEAGWKRVDIPAVCHAAGRVRGSKLRGEGAAQKHAARVETVLINPAAQLKLSKTKALPLQLF